MYLLYYCYHHAEMYGIYDLDLFVYRTLVLVPEANNTL